MDCLRIQTGCFPQKRTGCPALTGPVLFRCAVLCPCRRDGAGSLGYNQFVQFVAKQRAELCHPRDRTRQKRTARISGRSQVHTDKMASLEGLLKSAYFVQKLSKSPLHKGVPHMCRSVSKYVKLRPEFRHIFLITCKRMMTKINIKTILLTLNLPYLSNNTSEWNRVREYITNW